VILERGRKGVSRSRGDRKRSEGKNNVVVGLRRERTKKPEDEKGVAKNQRAYIGQVVSSGGERGGRGGTTTWPLGQNREQGKEKNDGEQGTQE